MKCKLPEHTDTAPGGQGGRRDRCAKMARVTKLGSKCSWPQGSHPAEYHHGSVAALSCYFATLHYRDLPHSLCLKSWHPSLRKRKSKNSSPLETTSQSLY